MIQSVKPNLNTHDKSKPLEIVFFIFEAIQLENIVSKFSLTSLVLTDVSKLALCKSILKYKTLIHWLIYSCFLIIPLPTFHG